MALPQVFTPTPIEAGIWTAAVGTQAEIARAITSSPVFWAVVSLAIGFALVKALLEIGSGGRGHAFKQFMIFLLCVGLGLSFLKKTNSTAFSPVNANGREWRSVPKVASNLKYRDVQSRENGLFWYTLMHRSISEIALFMTRAVNATAGDPRADATPEYILHALAQTARVSIDDPGIERTFDKLVFNCTDSRKGKVLGENESLKTMFDLNNPQCNELYNSLTGQLKTWVVSKRPAYFRGPPPAAGSINAQAFKMYDLDRIDNKLIASAVKNYAREKSGEASAIRNTNNDALIDGSDFWVNVDKFTGSSLFLMGANLFLPEPRDLEGASARNEAAVMYNKLLQFLPAIRGYACAILAYAFIVGVLALCIGTHGFFLGWLRMTAIFCLYMPFSAALYQFTSRMITTTENIRAMDAIAVDPMILSGANILDASVSRMTAVYFCLQIALLSFFAMAGIKSFSPIQSLNHNFAGKILQRVFYTGVALTRFIPGMSSLVGGLAAKAANNKPPSAPK